MLDARDVIVDVASMRDDELKISNELMRRLIERDALEFRGLYESCTLPDSKCTSTSYDALTQLANGTPWLPAT